jgi:integrase
LRKDDLGYFFEYSVIEDGIKRKKLERLGNIPCEQAKRIVLKNSEAIAEGKYFEKKKLPITFSQAADAFLEYSKSRKKSFKQDGFYVANLKRYFGNKPLEQLNLDLVEGYINWRKSTGIPKGDELQAPSLNRDLACLKTIVSRARLNRQIDRNPIEGIKLFKEIPRDRTLTDEEYPRLLEHCQPHIKPIVEFAYKSAMRKGEILGLTWEKVDFRNGFIILEAEGTKTQEKREIPIDEGLKKILRGIPREIACSNIFTYRGKKLKDCRTAYSSACEKAGIEDFHFHDLRHCAITNMRKAGVPDSVIMSISGHKTDAVFRRYDRIDREDRKNALEKVNIWASSKEPYKSPEVIKAV